MSKNLKSIVEELKTLFRPKGVNYGKIYDALYQMEVCTSPLSPDETEEQWEARFVERHGTREEFVNERIKAKEG